MLTADALYANLCRACFVNALWMLCGCFVDALQMLFGFVWRAFGKGPKALTKACGKGQGWPRRCQTLCECFVNAL